MKHLHHHALVLGTGLVLASGIILVRTSHSSSEDPTEAPRETQDAPAPAAAKKDSAEDRAIAEAEDCFKQAAQIFHAAGREEGREGERLQAKKLLEQAQDLLAPLSEENETVKDLRSKVGRLRLDVLKVSDL